MENKMIITGMTINELAQAIFEIFKEYITQQALSNSEENDDLITIPETCKILRINKTTLWKHTKSGRLTKYGIGNRVYYKKTEVLASIVKIN
jgi:hypothetical protein